jgi:hypothetical protein
MLVRTTPPGVKQIYKRRAATAETRERRREAHRGMAATALRGLDKAAGSTRWVDRVDCGKRRDAEPVPGQGTLEDCVRSNLKIGDPLGIPADAAEELGEYAGPLEVPLPYAQQ